MKMIRPLLVIAPLTLIALLVFKPDSSKPPPAAILAENGASGQSLSSNTVSASQQRNALGTFDSEATDDATRQGTDPDSTVKEELTAPEQRSLWRALSEARREVREIPKAWAERKENLGYDFYALHPKQNLSTRFGAEGIQVVSSERSYTEADAEHPTTAWEARLRLRAFAGHEVPPGARPEKSAESGSRVEYRHSVGLTEWYDNGVEAMEHGFTVAGRPAHLKAGEEVVLEMSLEGLKASGWDSEQGNLMFRDGEREVLGYEKLVVIDAEGRELPARMEATGDGFLLAYHDAGARYPVTVDPLLVNQEAKFNRFDAAAGDQFGFAVSVSGDTVVIGSYLDDDGGSNSGSAYVFSRNGSSWLFQAKLTAMDAAGEDRFGVTVSISGDTVAVSAQFDDDGGSSSGSAYVFTRSGTAWSQQAKLTALDAAANDEFGVSVCISGDTVAVGARYDDDGGSDAGSAYVFTRSGITWSQQAKLTASDAAVNDWFGSSVALSGDTVVVGSYFGGNGGIDSGSAYVFIRTGSAWSQQAELVASDAAANDGFGGSVSISGETVVVGARSDDDGGDDSGSAYVFVRSGAIWSEQAKLSASAAAAGNAFGTSVSVSGESVLVGAPFDGGGDFSGRAYVFIRSGSSWNQQAQLTASDAAPIDYFGGSVSISGDTLVVGAARDDDGGNNAGSAYVFVRSGISWTQQAKLTAFDAATEDRFGTSVSLAGNTVVIGTPLDDDGGANSGSAYVFTRNGASWIQQAKLTAADAAADDNFGNAVSLSGDTVVVGAYLDDDGGSGSGSVYVFNRIINTWTQQAKLIASDHAAGDNFGKSVSVSGDTAAVGSPFDDDVGTNSGSAYVFARSGSLWTQQSKLIAADGSAGDNFGTSVSLFEGTVVVGAPHDNTGVPPVDTGSAYVFIRSGISWNQQSKLTAGDAAAGDNFGSSVSVSGNTAVIGAPFDDASLFLGNTGSAYVFTRSGVLWNQQSKLTASDAGVGDNFGTSVSISVDTVVAGSPFDDEGSSNSGSAYVYTRSGVTWTQQNRLNAGDAAASDSFGSSVSLSGNTLVVGSTGDDDGGFLNSGSVYVYRLAVPSVRRLLVSDHLGNPVSPGGYASAFNTQRNGTSIDYIFVLTNTGELGLNLQTISLGGADADQFGLVVPDISSSVDLTQSQSLNLAVTFQPSGGSGLRNASLVIFSDDTATPVLTVNLSGLGLSDAADSDGDGMNDWAEHALRRFGFDWETAQDNFVSDFYAFAPDAGLVALDDIAALQANTTIRNVNPVTNRADFVIQLKQSDDLTPPFNPIIANSARISVDGQGRIVYEVDAPEGKRFYMMGVGP